MVTITFLFPINDSFSADACKISNPKGNSLNVREGPGLDYDIMSALDNGDVVDLVNTKFDDDDRIWANIEYIDYEDNVVNGWVSKAYLTCTGQNTGRRAAAIAKSTTTYHTGAGKGISSTSSYTTNLAIAVNKAIQTCLLKVRNDDDLSEEQKNNAHCELVISTTAEGYQCLALSVSENNWSGGSGKTKAAAKNDADENCGDDCRTATTICAN